MGFLSRFREQTKRATLPMLLATAGSIGVGTRAAQAADVVNLGAARVAGAQGSDWHDRQLVMDKGTGSSFTVYVTPRGQAFSPGDPSLSVVLQPGETRVIDDLYQQLIGEGAGTIRIIPDEGTNAPLWRSVIFNQDGEAEYGMTSKPFSEENDGYHSNSTLAAMLSPSGFRDNIDLVTGNEGVTGAWTYSNSAGGNGVTIDKSYAANTTEQFSARALLGFEPEPGAKLEYSITDGSARVFLSRNHNVSNDPSRDEFEVTQLGIPPEDVAALYVNQWLPQGRFYLNNTEVKGMVNGGTGSRSYAPDLAAEFWNDPNVQANFGSVSDVEQWLRDRADGVPDNSEFCDDFDPLQWTEGIGVRTYGGASCGPVDFSPGDEALGRIYTLIKGINPEGEQVDGFLVNYVRNNPSHYGGVLGGVPDMDHNPTWNTQDPN